MCIVRAGDEQKKYLKYDLFQNTHDSLTSVWIQPPPPFLFLIAVLCIVCWILRMS